MKQTSILPLFLTLSGLLLSACAGTPASSSESVSESSSESTSESSSSVPAASASSLKEALAKLSSSKNYTVETTIKKQFDTTTFCNYFTEHYSYCDYADAEEGFVEKDGSIFRVDLFEGEYLPSDEYEGSSLWESDLIHPLTFPATSYASLEGKEGEITNKVAKLNFLKFLEIEPTYLTYVTSFTAKMSQDSLNSLVFKMIFTMDSGSTTVYTCSVTDFGRTAHDDLEEYLATAKPAVYPDVLKAVAADFATNNFTRTIQDELTLSDSKKTLYGYEYYLPDYFYTWFNSASGAAVQSNGYLSLHPKKMLDGHPEYGTFDGAYYFTLNEDCSAINGFLSQGPAFVTNVYDMPTIMNYPSFLTMLSHNFQFFKLDMSSPFDGTSYKTTNLSLVFDFFNNCQIINVLGEFETLYLRSLTVAFDEGDSEEDISDDKISFLLSFKKDGEYFDCEYLYHGFGASQIPCVEEFKLSFVDAQ